MTFPDFTTEKVLKVDMAITNLLVALDFGFSNN